VKEDFFFSGLMKGKAKRGQHGLSMWFLWLRRIIRANKRANKEFMASTHASGELIFSQEFRIMRKGGEHGRVELN